MERIKKREEMSAGVFDVSGIQRIVFMKNSETYVRDYLQESICIDVSVVCGSLW